ncbi:MAG TPA: RNA polymerase sigma factor SigE, partial [Verrucomicrobia bacterium]|nr:RNA polymerase sigma factor SigE [Verrucomicrobiota bacterium]
PERLRVVVVMCDIQNHSYEEAAVLLGISYDAIRQRHSRARARLDPLVKRFVRDIGHESESDVS